MSPQLERYYLLKNAGLCVTCKQEREDKTHVRCNACRALYTSTAEAEHKYARGRYARLKRRHQCPRCRKALPPECRFVFCTEDRMKFKAANDRRRGKQWAGG